MNRKWLYAAALVALLVPVSACGDDDGDNDNTNRPDAALTDSGLDSAVDSAADGGNNPPEPLSEDGVLPTQDSTYVEGDLVPVEFMTTGDPDGDTLEAYILWVTDDDGTPGQSAGDTSGEEIIGTTVNGAPVVYVMQTTGKPSSPEGMTYYLKFGIRDGNGGDANLERIVKLFSKASVDSCTAIQTWEYKGFIMMCTGTDPYNRTENGWATTNDLGATIDANGELTSALPMTSGDGGEHSVEVTYFESDPFTATVTIDPVRGYMLVFCNGGGQRLSDFPGPALDIAATDCWPGFNTAGKPEYGWEPEYMQSVDAACLDTSLQGLPANYRAMLVFYNDGVMPEDNLNDPTCTIDDVMLIYDHMGPEF
ncbi:hypothetical protein ACFL0V_07485 [Nanoarchaeota archaeon]